MSPSRDEELAALIAEQAADDAYGHSIRYPRAVSLDAALGAESDAGSLLDIIGGDDQRIQDLIDDRGVRLNHAATPQRWTRKAIVKAIKAWAAEHGEPPTHSEWKSPNGRGIPSTTSVRRRFGTFRAAVEAAGFTPREVGRRGSDIGKNRLHPRTRRQKRTARLTQAHIAAAYVLYERQGLSLPQLAERLWAKYGYASPASCRVALERGFHYEGFRMRSMSEAQLACGAETLRARGVQGAQARWGQAV